MQQKTQDHGFIQPSITPLITFYRLENAPFTLIRCFLKRYSEYYKISVLLITIDEVLYQTLL